MVRYKVVFRDREVDKCIFGKIEIEDQLIKVFSDNGNIVYINKSNIIFMKELTGGNHGY